MEKSAVKYAGLAIIIIFAIVLLGAFFVGNVNNNAVNFGIYGGLIVGFIVYIIGAKIELVGISNEHINGSAEEESEASDEKTEVVE